GWNRRRSRAVLPMCLALPALLEAQEGGVLVWTPPTDPPSDSPSARLLEESLGRLGFAYDDRDDFPPPDGIVRYAAVFGFLGTFPAIHRLTQEEDDRLLDYLTELHGRLYL